jgi:hypothetical protein
MLDITSHNIVGCFCLNFSWFSYHCSLQHSCLNMQILDIYWLAFICKHTIWHTWSMLTIIIVFLGICRSVGNGWWDSYFTQLEKQVQCMTWCCYREFLYLHVFSSKTKSSWFHKNVNAKGQIQHRFLAMCIFFCMLKVHIEGGLSRFLQDRS